MVLWIALYFLKMIKPNQEMIQLRIEYDYSFWSSLSIR